MFTKVPESLIGPADTVRLRGDAVPAQIDDEAELAVVLGKTGRNIARAEAMSHVFGCTIVNDVTSSATSRR